MCLAGKPSEKNTGNCKIALDERAPQGLLHGRQQARQTLPPLAQGERREFLETVTFLHIRVTSRSYHSVTFRLQNRPKGLPFEAVFTNFWQGRNRGPNPTLIGLCIIPSSRNLTSNINGETRCVPQPEAVVRGEVPSSDGWRKAPAPDGPKPQLYRRLTLGGSSPFVR